MFKDLLKAIFGVAPPKRPAKNTQGVARPKRPAGEPSPWPSDYRREVVGESHCQDALSEICGGKTRDTQRVACRATLHCEDDNPYDPTAVRVEVGGRKVGYLKRAETARYRQTYGVLEPQECNAMIVGGWRTNQHAGGQGHFGIRLDLKLPRLRKIDAQGLENLK